ncbi:PAS domain S-box protein [Halolamina salifodinae]|uniref:PAS domain S-box-containing protein n=1 Tax=Halolamina salifodinae TaxID=1202767 RepID=A0A8T4H0B0_9EURY|nr:PAS domain S-box protein [Halolamina salifodinae]MBP1988120.1 PAS domain S-box-containing protein [Halolamina salifodinae]
MSDSLRVVAVGEVPPSLADREGFAVQSVSDTGGAMATLETSAVDCLLLDADWAGVPERVRRRFPDVSVVVYAETDAVDLDAVLAVADGFVAREAGETLLAHRLPRIASEKASASAMLDRESARFQELAKSVGVGILSIDQDSVVQFANPAIEDVLGWPPMELEGESLGVLIPDRLRTRHFEGMKEYLSTGERQLDWSGVDLPAEHREGHELEVRISFGEFKHDSEHYFTGVITPVDVDDDLRAALEAAHDSVVNARDRHDDRTLAEAAETLSELLARLEQ